MEVQRYFFIIVLSALLALPDSMYGRVKQDTTVINRIFRYAASVDTSGIKGTHTYAYQRFFINTKNSKIRDNGCKRIWSDFWTSICKICK